MPHSHPSLGKCVATELVKKDDGTVVRQCTFESPPINAKAAKEAFEARATQLVDGDEKKGLLTDAKEYAAVL